MFLTLLITIRQGFPVIGFQIDTCRIPWWSQTNDDCIFLLADPLKICSCEAIWSMRSPQYMSISSLYPSTCVFLISVYPSCHGPEADKKIFEYLSTLTGIVFCTGFHVHSIWQLSNDFIALQWQDISTIN